MSSSSESSDTEDEKKVTRSDSSEDDSDTVKKSRSSNKQFESGDSGSESDSDGSDSDNDQPSSSRKRPAVPKKAPIKRRKRGDSEEDKNRELFDNEDDYNKWRQMSEKDREQKIFELMEQKEINKKREQITQKLKAQNNDTSDSERRRKSRRDDKRKRVESDSSDEDEAKPAKGSSDSELDADFHRPSEVDKKRKQKSAMADLLAKRKDKEKKKGKALLIESVFGKEKDDGSDSSSSSSESSTNSSRSSSSSPDSSPTRKNSDDERDAAAKKPIETKDDLVKARMSRFKLSKIVHAPFFGDVVTGSFVRIQTGPIPGSKSKYRIARALGVVQTAKIYTLEGTKTNKGLKLKWGKHERVYRLEFVSNTEFPDDEFEEWKEVTIQEDNLPSVEHVQKKQKEINKAMNHNFTSEEIDFILKEKGRFTKTPRNYAMSKGELMKKKEYAEQCGDIKEAQRLQREIEELDSKAEQLDKARSADISAITWINQRNRNKMKQAFLGDQVQIDMTSEDDPFTRKKERMKVVSSSGRKDKQSSANKEEDEEDAPAAAPVASAPKPALSPAKSSAVVHSKTYTLPSTSLPSRANKSGNDLFNLHSKINEIDLDIDLNKLAAVRDPMPSRLDDFDSNSMRSSTAPQSDNRRMVSLDDYRKRMAARAANSSQGS